MTSNIGAEKLQKEAKLGFNVADKEDFDGLAKLHESNKEKVTEELKKYLRPELLNRIDKAVVFNVLTKNEVTKILELQLDELRKRLVKNSITFELTPKARSYLIKHGYDPKNGVRPLRRLIQETIEDTIATGILGQKYSKGSLIKISAKDNHLEYKIVHESTPKKN